MTERANLAVVVAISMVIGCDGMAGREVADGNDYTNLEDGLELIYKESSQSGYFPSRPGSIMVRDLNGDGLDDLIVFFSQLQVTNVGLNTTDLATRDPKNLFMSFNWVRFPQTAIPSVADLDGDGMMELLTLNYEKNVIDVFELAGQREKPEQMTLQQRDSMAMPECLMIVQQADAKYVFPFYFEDVNGDGRTDLLCGSGLLRDLYIGGNAPAHGNGTVHLALAGGAGFGPALQFEMATNPLALGDFDGDKQLDYLGSDPERGALLVGYGDGAGRFAPAVTVETIPAYRERWDAVRGPAFVPTIGDFNGDGRSDIYWVETQSQRWSPYTIKANGEEYSSDWIYQHTEDPVVLVGGASGEPFPRLPAYTHLDLWSAVSVAADIDGDGTKDLVQLGWDRDFGETVGPFIRVISFAAETPSVTSNTEMAEPIQITDRPAGFLSYRLASGRFYNNGREQLLVLNEDTLGISVYQGR